MTSPWVPWIATLSQVCMPVKGLAFGGTSLLFDSPFPGILIMNLAKSCFVTLGKQVVSLSKSAFPSLL